MRWNLRIPPISLETLGIFITEYRFSVINFPVFNEKLAIIPSF